MSEAANPKSVERSSGGLRAALFDEIDALRRGESNAARARSVAMLANSVLQSVSAEIEYHKYVSDATKTSASQKLGVLELAPPSRPLDDGLEQQEA
jgi:hypothetical protein